MASYLHNILLGNSYIGIECFSANNEDRYAFLQVTRKKNNLEIAEKEVFKNIEDLKSASKKLPVTLIVNNSYVLQKEIIGNDNNDKKLLHKAFPNIQLDDFYYEIWRRGTTAIIAVCRKSYIDELVHTMSDNFRIVSISLGLCTASGIASFITEESIVTNSHELYLHTDENSIKPLISPEKPDYDVNGLSVNSQWLMAFAGVLNCIIPTDKTSGSILELKKTLEEDFKQNSFFEKTLRFSIGLILGLLLINFLLFSHYFKKNNEMDTTLSMSKVEIEKIGSLKKQVTDKESRLESFANNTASRSSLLLNKITASVPSSILLTELVYHPLEKRIKESEPIQPQDSIIIISGKILSNQDFTNWVSEIEKLDDIEKITITSFGKENNNTEFSLKAETK